MKSPTNILTVGGLDPLGYAGVIADALTLSAVGVQPQVVITAQTQQLPSDESSNIQPSLNIVDYTLLAKQLDAIFAAEMPAAIKIGQVPDARCAEVVAQALQKAAASNMPVVWDPVLRSSSGVQLSTLTGDTAKPLLGSVSLLTPNVSELLALTAESTTMAAVNWLFDNGCAAVLVTGTDTAADDADLNYIEHYLYTPQEARCISVPRLPGVYRGTGCRFSSLIATALAQGHGLYEAAQWAQQTMNKMLLAAKPVANGIYLPNTAAEFANA